MITARVLNEGNASGEVLVLDEPLSFWGAFDPGTGDIIDVHHSQRGTCVRGTILLMRESRGSGSAPGALAEAIRLGTAPAAIILVTPDVNLAIGAEVAKALYGRTCAIFAVTADEYDSLRCETLLHVTVDGAISRETV